MTQPWHSRGRGRSRTQLLTNSYDIISLSAAVISNEVTLPISSSIVDDNQSESDFSSASSYTKSSTSSQTNIYNGHGHGRGAHLKQNVVPDDPHWIVTKLTDAQFKSNIRPKKPNELGTLGDHIQVTT